MGKCKIVNTSCRVKRPRQTGQTQIRLLLKKQSDQCLPCLLFRQAFWEFQDTKLTFYLRTEGEKCSGAQWLSDRVLDSRPRGRGFEPHWRHCVVVLEQDTFILA